MREGRREGKMEERIHGRKGFTINAARHALATQKSTKTAAIRATVPRLNHLQGCENAFLFPRNLAHDLSEDPARRSDRRRSTNLEPQFRCRRVRRGHFKSPNLVQILLPSLLPSFPSSSPSFPTNFGTLSVL